MFNFTFAFQPIIDIAARRVFAYEALVRGRNNESAGEVFAGVQSSELHVFDRDARVHAIQLAATLAIDTGLSLNLLPKGLELLPDAISTTVEAVAKAGIPPERIYIEVTEGEIIDDRSGFVEKLNEFRRLGMNLVIDDFGAGYSGLNLLADFPPDVVKIDIQLVRGIDTNGPRQAIVRAILQCCQDLGIEVVAEGVESEPEYRWFKRRGVRLFQGFFFARPSFEALAIPIYPTT